MKRRVRPLPPARVARLEAERVARRAEAARKKPKRTHFLYFLVCEGYVKIGYGSDPTQRCSCAQVGNPFPVSLAGVALGGEREERALHLAFRDLHVRAEWFRLEGPLSEVVSKVGEINDPQSARAWLGEWLVSFNGSLSLLADLTPHKTRHMDVRTGHSNVRKPVILQREEEYGSATASGL